MLSDSSWNLLRQLSYLLLATGGEQISTDCNRKRVTSVNIGWVCFVVQLGGITDCKILSHSKEITAFYLLYLTFYSLDFYHM